MGIILLKFLFVLFIVNVYSVSASDCPSKCSCKRSNQADSAEWVKVRCGDTEKVQSLDELDLNNIASEIVQLNLSSNFLTVFAPKTQFIALQKLDISRNQISTLSEQQFIELPNLRRLDISGNSIKNITKHTFQDLRNLERLKLNQNQITTIEKGAFDDLENLKQIDISNNPLTCDCELLWLLEWAEKTSVKLISSPKCASPASFKGAALKKLKIGVHVHCKSPAGNREMPLVELTPNLSQVVFEGDSLTLNCRAPSISNSYNIETKEQIEWVWLNKNPREFLQHIEIENRFLEDSGLIDSSLTIRELTTNHSGTWNCHLVSNKQNQSKKITILVISNDTQYCQATQTTNNKGTYYWPRTVVNNTVSLPCESIQQTNDIPIQRATYFCSATKKWEFFNTTKCSYISDTTKILEQFSKVNLSIGKGGIIDSAKHFKNYIADLSLLQDVADLVYAVRTIENYLQFVSVEKELGSLLMDVSSNIMHLNGSYIKKACVEDNSCGKLLSSLEKIADYALPQKSNVALEVFPVNPRSFTGMTCTWYSSRTNSEDRKFYCIRTNQVPRTTAPDKAIEASIQIPASFFYNLEKQDLLLNPDSNKILVSVFADAKLFPTRELSKTLVSGVAGVKLDNFIVHNLTEPITVMLRSRPQNKNTEFVPVWWNAAQNNGTGEWTTDGCHLMEELEDCVVFRCHQLGYYSLRQNVTYMKYHTKFKLSHPAIYIGSLILFLCLLTSILTYIFCYVAIQMPKKAKHSLINIWISISLLCFMYVFGIYQTEDVELCEGIGLVLHYLTLSSLLWMCVGVNGMYKRLRRNDSRLEELQDDELPSEEPIRKPIIGLYFVGWGVALIVCGISSAVNMREYASNTHCFLNSEPALSALYIPFGILIVTITVYFCLIRCAMYNVDAGGHLSEGTQATENVDLDLLESNFPNMDVYGAPPSLSTKTGSSELEDPEHAPIVQLKSYIIFLLLYILTWVTCALATTQPVKLKHYEEVFCIGYAVLCIILGSFTVFFYCIARNDVRTQWVKLGKNFRRKSLIRSRNISDTVAQIQIQPLPPIPTDDIRVTSRSSSRSSRTNNRPDLTYSNTSNKNNANMVMLHRHCGTIVPNRIVTNLIENPTNSAEMFYNPHQSTVARKFFRKQKQNMLKRNNLVTKRSEMNDNSSVASYPKQLKDNSSVDQSIFSSNAKVNNTNIHVEKVRKTKMRNPNMLLDSCEDVHDGENTFKERRRRGDKHKKKQNTCNLNSSVQENNMRSVSQQCTLEYSSEPISDSILDQKSPEKFLMIPENFTTSDNPTDNVQHVNKMLHTLYEPSEGSSFSEFDKMPPRIYVNPSHELLFSKSAQSRASSVSASEIDELYQDIRRGNRNKPKSSYRHRYDPHIREHDSHFRQPSPSIRQPSPSIRQPSPSFSDSEITSAAGEVRYRCRRNFFDDPTGSDKIESRV